MLFVFKLISSEDMARTGYIGLLLVGLLADGLRADFYQKRDTGLTPPQSSARSVPKGPLPAATGDDRVRDADRLYSEAHPPPPESVLTTRELRIIGLLFVTASAVAAVAYLVVRNGRPRAN